MLDEKTLFVMKTDKDSKLLEKFMAIANPAEGKEIEINDLLNSNQFTSEEQSDLRRLFKGDLKSIKTKDFNFYAKGDQWVYEQNDYLHTYALNLLSKMNTETEYKYDSKVDCSDLHLVASLIEQYNNILKVDKTGKIDELLEGYKISEEMTQFISGWLSKNSGNLNLMNYDFIRLFIEALQEFDDLLWDRVFMKEVQDQK
ncbi:MAG TPA: hypothetical protein VK564_01840 [Thermodesulfobacteriota bacterium]|nr:hypothetical protein [Thermodesulfobacteriota bacterium]